MKAIEKKKALLLRTEGKSIKEIGRELGVAKSSVSVWVRNVELTEDQKSYLKEKGLFREKIERTRKTRLANERYKRNEFIKAAQITIPKIDKKQLWLMGVMLYWGEGGKTRRTVCFSNSDPALIKIIMLFFRDICEVPEEKFRAHLHIHEHLDRKAAKTYWSYVSGIQLSSFYKVSTQQSRASQGKKDSLPYGTLNIYILDTLLFYKIVGWSRSISIQLYSKPVLGFGAYDRLY